MDVEGEEGCLAQSVGHVGRRLGEEKRKSMGSCTGRHSGPGGAGGAGTIPCRQSGASEGC